MAHENSNPRYKGKNFDPNYNARRNQSNQQHPQGNDSSRVNYPPTHGNPFQQQGPHTRHNQAQQQQHYPHHQQQHPHQHHQQQRHQQHNQQQQQQQYISSGSSAAAMQVLENFRNEVHKAITRDIEGDIHMCQCPNPGGTLCFHGITSLYQKQLMVSAGLQHDVVELLNFLIEGESPQGSISTRLAEYINSNPGTSLFTVVEAMDLNGLLTGGFGNAVGSAGVDPSGIR
ncbi:hypothetical protein F4782DRAFT_80184 [Xylaria castorea]|nr:hypothetical protein F4782DRAFT_80184 [Xylaria castorea]